MSTRSTNRLPPAESVPQLVFRQQTARQHSHSAALFVGVIPLCESVMPVVRSRRYSQTTRNVRQEPHGYR